MFKNYHKELYLFLIMLMVIFICCLIEPKDKEISASLDGNGYEIHLYDNRGIKNISLTGEKINIKSNKVALTKFSAGGTRILSYELSPVITINVDGNYIETSSDTCVFIQDGIEAVVDFSDESISNTTYESPILLNIINQNKNLFTKEKIVILKTKSGYPISIYSGNEISWEVPTDFPNTTKLLLDDKALYICRANFEIIDIACLN